MEDVDYEKLQVSQQQKGPEHMEVWVKKLIPPLKTMEKWVLVKSEGAGTTYSKHHKNRPVIFLR